MKYLGLFVFSLLLLIGCKEEEKEESQASVDDTVILDYLELHPTIKAQKHSSGIYYQILTEGSGGHPNSRSTVKVKYKGYLTNNVVFDQTEIGETATFGLPNLIEGWQIGIPLLKRGGKGLFLIPSGLGYGSRASGTIPANSVLIFEMELKVIL